MNLHAAAEGQAPATSPRPPISWQDGFAALGPDFFTHLRPTPLPEPHWIATSTGTAELLGLDPQWLASDEALQALTGNAVLPGSHPLASVYSGHQFGVWAGQLGDGRAILLGETASGHEIQLKGAGRTPYSRMGRRWVKKSGPRAAKPSCQEMGRRGEVAGARPSAAACRFMRELSPSAYAPWDARFMRAFTACIHARSCCRYWPGGMPNHRRQARKRLLWSTKPSRSATSARLWRGSPRYCRASSRRVSSSNCW